MVETAQIVISLAIFKVLNFVQVMKYINLTLMSHILPTSGNETIGEQTGDYYLLQCLYPLRSVSKNTTKRSTAQRPEEVICCL